MANQHLTLVHGHCCINNVDLDHEHADCHATPRTKLPAWIRESEYFKDPPVGEEGGATGVAGTNPAGWKTYGMGLKPHLATVTPAAFVEAAIPESEEAARKRAPSSLPKP